MGSPSLLLEKSNRFYSILFYSMATKNAIEKRVKKPALVPGGKQKWGECSGTIKKSWD